MRKVRRLVVLLLVILFCLAGPSVMAATKAQPPALPDPSTEELKDLVRFLEDDAERDRFINRLKQVIREKERLAPGAAPADGQEQPDVLPEISHPFFRALEKYSKNAVREIRKIIIWTGTLPETLQQAAVFVTDEDHRARLLNLALCLGAGIFIAAWIAFMFKRRGPAHPEEPIGRLKRSAYGIASIFIGVIPYVVLLFVVYGLFDTFNALPEGREAVLFFLTVLLYYQLVFHIGRALLSPYDPILRLVPIPDPEAQYLWSWFVRLAKYTAFYVFVLDGLLVYMTNKTAFFAFRNTLVLIFPILLTVFVVRFSLRMKSRRKTSPVRRDPAEVPLRVKLLDLVWAYWPVPVILYAWTISILVVGRYAEGIDYLVWSTVQTALVVIAGLVITAVADQTLARLFPRDRTLEGRFFAVVQIVIKIMVVAAVALALAHFWGVPLSRLAGSQIGSDLLTRFLAIALTIGVAAAVMSSSQLVTDWLLEEREGEEVGRKRKTLTPIVNTAIKAFTVFIGVIIILDRLYVNIGPILAGAGIIGLGVGLGAQSLVKDFINGLFILFQDMISVGDWIRIGDKDGLVEAISLRAVRIRDLSGNVHIIPNSAIESVTNMTKVFSRYVFDIGVSYREDVDEVISVLEELGRELRADPAFGRDILEPLEILGLQRFDDSAVIIRARVTTRPMQQWIIGREFNRRIKKAFDEKGIEIPFPHRTVYMGEPKHEPAPPLHVAIQSPETAPPRGEADGEGE